MLHNPAWQAADALTRAQLALLSGLGREIGLTPDDRRRALDLDDRTWAEWMAFLDHGPLPARPALPDMLRRVGQAAFHIDVVASLRG